MFYQLLLIDRRWFMYQTINYYADLLTKFYIAFKISWLSLIFIFCRNIRVYNLLIIMHL